MCNNILKIILSSSCKIGASIYLKGISLILTEAASPQSPDHCVCSPAGQSSFCCHHVLQGLRDTVFSRDRGCVTGPGQLLALRPNRGAAKNPRQVWRAHQLSRELPLGIGTSGSHRDKYQTGNWSLLTRLFLTSFGDNHTMMTFVYQCQYYQEPVTLLMSASLITMY